MKNYATFFFIMFRIIWLLRLPVENCSEDVFYMHIATHNKND